MNIKKFLFLFLLAPLPFFANAQGEFRLGFKGNPLFSTIRPNTDFHKSEGTKVGLSYGLMFDYFIKDNYALSSEFAITSQGGKLAYSRADTTVESDIRLRYIEIPLVIKLRTNDISEGIRIFGKFGLGLGFNIKSSAKIDYKKGNTYFAKDDIKSASSYIQPFNASLIVGGGVEYNLAENFDLVLGLTYSNGFSNIMKDKNIFRYPSTNVSMFEGNTSYFALNIGLMF